MRSSQRKMFHANVIGCMRNSVPLTFSKCAKEGVPLSFPLRLQRLWFIFWMELFNFHRYEGNWNNSQNKKIKMSFYRLNLRKQRCWKTWLRVWRILDKVFLRFSSITKVLCNSFIAFLCILQLKYLSMGHVKLLLRPLENYLRSNRSSFGCQK